MPFKLQPNQKFLFIGDSITDAGRRHEAIPYGLGYMSMVRDAIIARHPELNFTFENRGTGGDTIRNLKARWEQDVTAEKPDALSVMIGINDVWRAFGSRPHEAVPLDEFEATYRELLTRTQQTVAPQILIVADPYFIEPDRRDPMREMMDRYGRVSRRMAREFGAIHIPVQAVFDKVLKIQPKEFWADDRVHPYSVGHMLIAQAYLKALGWRL